MSTHPRDRMTIVAIALAVTLCGYLSLPLSACPPYWELTNLNSDAASPSNGCKLSGPFTHVVDK